MPVSQGTNSTLPNECVIYNLSLPATIKNASLFQVVSKDIARNTVVVFDEAHNIDNICIDSMSVRLTKRLLNKCVTSITTLEATIKQQKDANSDKLKSEYEKLVEGLRQASKK